MLTKVEIENFKNFDNNFTFDLTQTKSFEFNKECVVDGVVNKALIYGHNGVGKSNLGFAIFDLISHLTDKNNASSSYKNYLNANSSKDFATFKFEFKFNEKDIVKYEYQKMDSETLINESLYINGRLFTSINRLEKIHNLIIKAKGAESLKTDLTGTKVSILSYIDKNAVLDLEHENILFKQFLNFVNGMLFFRSLEQNNYIGYEQGSNYINSDIIEHGNLGDFEQFLNNAGIECELDKIPMGDSFDIAFKFKNDKKIPFYDIASQGTKSLALFYYWYQRIKEDEKVSFIFIDEFDAFYHHELSNLIISKMKEINAQVIMTSHNTSIMTNDLLRPDCYFLFKKDEIKSLSNSTIKELRSAHNIEKMYRAGSFE